MWYLKSKHDGALFYILPKKINTINRGDGDLVLAGDMSISRHHGAVGISEDDEVYVWDQGSKYGTFRYKRTNGQGPSVKEQIKKTKTKIKEGDSIQFGVQWHVFTLCKADVVVCSSMITAEEKKILQTILEKIGGKFQNHWDTKCTHLTMNLLTLTRKVVHALADGKPIVTLGFWQKMEEAVTHNLELPKIQDYKPPTEEGELLKQANEDNVLPNENRKTLFTGKIFVFSSEDNKERYKSVVECAGGVCKSVQSSSLSPEECCKCNYIVIRADDDCQWKMRDIFTALKQEGLRFIDVSEIGMAIYNNSRVHYCNPSWHKPAILGKSPPQSKGVCWVENTEDIFSQKNIKVEPRDDIVIPPSLTSVASDTSIDTSRSLKRPQSPNDDRPTKRRNHVNEIQCPQTRQKSKSNKSPCSSKDSVATASFDTSLYDMFYQSCSVLPKTRNQKSVPEYSSNDDEDPFKVPSPKRVKEGRVVEEDFFKVPSPEKPRYKRGRPDNDPFELPAPKRAPAEKKKVDPLEDRTVIDGSIYRTKVLPTPSLSEYIDTSAAWPMEQENISKEGDPDLPKTSHRAKSEYMDLLRKIPAVVQYTADGKPNYKRFKKVLPKGFGVPKQYIKLIDDRPPKKYTGVPEIGPDLEIDEPEEEIFSVQTIQNRPNQQESTRIIDEWTVI